MTADALLTRLEAFAAAQSAALADGNDDALLAALSAKQSVLDAADLPALLGAAPPAAAAGLKDRVRALLDADAAALATATERRDALAADLTALDAAAPADAAYGDAPAARPRRLNVAG